MRIILPYGRSKVEPNQNKRKIDTRQKIDGGSDQQPIQPFATTHPPLVIAQWISEIDKVIKKPPKIDVEKDNPEQKKLIEQAQIARRALGDACWQIITTDNWMRQDKYIKMWRAKIKATATNSKYSQPKGRRFKVYTHELKINKTSTNTKNTQPKAPNYDIYTQELNYICQNSSAIATKINQHLYHNEISYNPKSDNQSNQGFIIKRAESIEKNYLRKKLDKKYFITEKYRNTWTPTDLEHYRSQEDIAVQILARIEKEKIPAHKIAAQELHRHYQLVFGEINISEAKKTKAGLIALHSAIRECYKSLLKPSGRMKQANNQQRIIRQDYLPKKLDQLLILVEAKTKNQNLQSLIRLGKVIHYTKTDDNLPTREEIVDSYYWSSEGQTAIKQTEAFVRKWRYMIAIAARSLRHWIAPNNPNLEDILTGAGKNYIQNNLSSYHENYKERLPLIFGSANNFFSQSEPQLVLENIRQVLSNFRNSTFHFKNLEIFINAIKNLSIDIPEAKQLITKDYQNQNQQLKAVLKGIKANEYYKTSDLQKIINQITSDNEKGKDLPLPKLKNVLDRHQKIFHHQLPEIPKNQSDREKDNWQCLYTILGLIYDKAFRNWFADSPVDIINTWIDRAVARDNQAAQRNKDKDNPEEVIRARAQSLGKLDTDETIFDFIHRLFAATATEMRVQNEYQSDPEQAKKQAKYINDLLLDVIGLALIEFLNTNHLQILSKKPKQLSSVGTIPEIPPLANKTFESWQANLYLILHLVPVNEVGQLMHQIRKWQAANKKVADQDNNQNIRELSDELLPIFQLYLDWHDAKFIADLEISSFDKFAKYYESREDFEQVFIQTESSGYQAIPRRGLRELLRFGDEVILEYVFEQYPIKKELFEQIKNINIKALQKDQIVLHEEWKECQISQKKRSKDQRKEFTKDNQYQQLVNQISQYNQIKNQIELNNHLWIYRLIIACLARLIDFSGLWERDLYFICLAKIFLDHKTLETTFNNNGLKSLNDGQIINALRNIKDKSFQSEIYQNFSKATSSDNIYQEFSKLGNIRNNFAHFNMLQDPSKILNLTQEINQCRQLMSYDRKLKNAITKSIKHLLAKDKLDIKWQIDPNNHQLILESIKPIPIKHLSGKFNEQPYRQEMVKMVEAFFGKISATKAIINR